MAYVNMNIRMDSEIKRQAQKSIMEKLLIFNKFGAKQPKLGGWEGKVWMSEDFDEPLEEFKEYM